jgi:hypothetical protein
MTKAKAAISGRKELPTAPLIGIWLPWSRLELRAEVVVSERRFKFLIPIPVIGYLISADWPFISYFSPLYRRQQSVQATDPQLASLLEGGGCPLKPVGLPDRWLV